MTHLKNMVNKASAKMQRDNYTYNKALEFTRTLETELIDMGVTPVPADHNETMETPDPHADSIRRHDREAKNGLPWSTLTLNLQHKSISIKIIMDHMSHRDAVGDDTPIHLLLRRKQDASPEIPYYKEKFSWQDRHTMLEELAVMIKTYGSDVIIDRSAPEPTTSLDRKVDLMPQITVVKKPNVTPK
jgi:hypothetical protein